MDFKMLKNPWVIGGGVVIGLILLMSKSGGSAAPKESGSYINEVNAIGYQANIQLAEISMQEAGLRYQHDATIMGYAFDSLMNRANIAANLQMTQAAGRAGIVAAQVTSASAAIQERAKMLNAMITHSVVSDPNFSDQMKNPGTSPQLEDSKKSRDGYSKKERTAVGFKKNSLGRAATSFIPGSGFSGVTIRPPIGTSA